MAVHIREINMSSLNELRKMVIQDQSRIQSERQLGERTQAELSDKVLHLHERLTDILRPLLASQFDQRPILSLKLSKSTDVVATVGGVDIRLPTLTIAVGRKGFDFNPVPAPESKELHYSAGLGAGFFSTNDAHVWVIAGPDYECILDEENLSEFLIDAFKEN
jgi:hypothetical protein